MCSCSPGTSLCLGAARGGTAISWASSQAKFYHLVKLKISPTDWLVEVKLDKTRFVHPCPSTHLARGWLQGGEYAHIARASASRVEQHHPDERIHQSSALQKANSPISKNRKYVENSKARPFMPSWLARDPFGWTTQGQFPFCVYSFPCLAGTIVPVCLWGESRIENWAPYITKADITPLYFSKHFPRLFINFPRN